MSPCLSRRTVVGSRNTRAVMQADIANSTPKRESAIAATINRNISKSIRISKSRYRISFPLKFRLATHTSSRFLTCWPHALSPDFLPIYGISPPYDARTSRSCSKFSGCRFYLLSICHVVGLALAAGANAVGFLPIRRLSLTKQMVNYAQRNYSIFPRK